MLIALDVPEENFLVHDTGRHRLAAQFVTLPNAKQVTTLTRIVLWYDQRHPAQPNGHTDFDNDEILSFIDDHAEAITECVREANEVMKYTMIPVGIHGAILFIAKRGGADPEAVGQWLEGLRSGSGLDTNDARLRLRNKVIREAALRKDKNAMWAMVVRAFNAFMQDRPIGALVSSSNDGPPPVQFSLRQRTALPKPRGGQIAVANYARKGHKTA